MKTAIITILLLLAALEGWSQDSLVLYTKGGCSNCAYAKATLSEKHVKYTELSVDITANAKAMLQALKEQKYTGPIFMPVILYKNKLQFPATQLGDSLTYTSLHEVVERLASIESLKSQEQSIQPKATNTSSDCEYVATSPDSVYYLISGNFTKREEAQHFTAVMNGEGYDKAFILEWQNIYRIAVAESNRKEDLLPLYKKIIQRYRGSYIFSTIK